MRVKIHIDPHPYLKHVIHYKLFDFVDTELQLIVISHKIIYESGQTWMKTATLLVQGGTQPWGINSSFNIFFFTGVIGQITQRLLLIKKYSKMAKQSSYVANVLF